MQRCASISNTHQSDKNTNSCHEWQMKEEIPRNANQIKRIKMDQIQQIKQITQRNGQEHMPTPVTNSLRSTNEVCQ